MGSNISSLTRGGAYGTGLDNIKSGMYDLFVAEQAGSALCNIPIKYPESNFIIRGSHRQFGKSIYTDHRVFYTPDIICTIDINILNMTCIDDMYDIKPTVLDIIIRRYGSSGIYISDKYTNIPTNLYVYKINTRDMIVKELHQSEPRLVRNPSINMDTI